MHKRRTVVLGSTLATALLLAACSSGLDAGTPAPTDEANLTPQATTATKPIPNGLSDAEEHGTSYYYDSTVLELGEKADTVSQLTGLRFTGMGVPKGATITSAKITFVAVTDQATATSLTVRGEKTVNAPEYTAGNPKISARPKTTAIANWTPGAWTNGTSYSVDNLRAVVQELVNQSGWTTSSPMAFVITGTGLRKAASYESSANPATLTVTYDAPLPPSTSCLQGASNVQTFTPSNDNGRTDFVQGNGANARINATGKTITEPPSTNKDQGVFLLTIRNNDPGLCFSGGKFDNRQGDNAQWEDPGYHNHFAVNVTDSPRVTIENVTVHQSGDAFAFKSTAGSADDWTVRDSYVRHAGDDFIENDAKYKGLVDDVLVDWAYMGVSCRKDANPALNPPGTITIQDSLIALKEQSNGHAFMFKFEQSSLDNCKLRLNNTIFYMESNNPVFRSTEEPTAYVTACSKVKLVYVGSGSYTDDQGRLAALRNKFDDPSCFEIVQGTVAQKQGYWRQQRDNWFARHTSNQQISAYRYNEP